jgi:hypothetical protein
LTDEGCLGAEPEQYGLSKETPVAAGVSGERFFWFLEK